MPFRVLGIWLRGLLAVLTLGLGVYFLCWWYTHREEIVYEQPVPAETRRQEPDRPRQGAAQDSAVDQPRARRVQSCSSIMPSSRTRWMLSPAQRRDKRNWCRDELGPGMLL